MLRKKSLVKRILAFLLCICMVVTSVGLDTGISVEAAPSNKPLDDTRLHFMIRHWHHNDALNSGDKNLVEGYIEKKTDAKGGVSYSLEWNNSIKKEDSGVTFDDKNGTVTIKPLPEKDNSGVALEEFAGFTVSAGPDAVDEHLATEESAGDTDGNYLVIKYDDNVHTVKAHVFYTETVMATGDDLGEEMQEIDTKMETLLEGDTEETKVYNTAAGLHTDKTAYETVDKDGKTDGRTFDLELESWFAGENLLDTGLVLDASGSMAFTSNYMDDKSKVYISDKTIAELKEKESINAGDPIPEEYIDTLLDKHYTDNSKLSYSGYNYFIYDPRSTTQEYVPLAYWSGEHYVPIIDKTATGNNDWTQVVPDRGNLVGFYTFDGTLDNTVSTGPLGAAKLVKQAKDNKDVFSSQEVVEGDAEYYVDGGITALDLQKTSENGAVLIDLPNEGPFTIAFQIKGEKFEDPKPNDETQILKIGAVDSDFKNSVYYEMRRGSSSSTNRLKMYKNDNGSADLNMNNVFKSDTWHSVIIIKEADEDIRIYLDGETIANNGSATKWDSGLNTMDNVGIILGGLIDSETVSHGIYLDNLLVYKSEVSDGNRKKLSNLALNKENSGKSLKWMYLAEDDEGNVIGQIDAAVAGCDSEDLCGWYYLNSIGDWGYYSDSNILTAKQLRGIITTKNNEKNGRKIKNDDGETIFYNNDGTDPDDVDNYCHKVDNYFPSYFYYKEGEETLYCAYCAGSDTYETSPVYIISDLDRIKEENLQAAVGNFIAELHEKSPDSRVSAVRFSNDSITEADYDKLVMLDWTMDPIEATNMLGLQWGEGAAQGTSMGSTTSNPDENEVKSEEAIQQYNYGLTGGTHTWVGLQAYLDELDNRIERTEDKAGEAQKAEKYLIIFTDGKDDDYFKEEASENKEKAKELAKQLKEKDYTIYCVMLTGGSLSGDSIQSTKDYLATLSGDEDYNPENDVKKEYPYVFQASNAAELQESFEEIVDRIYFSLKQYTVQDYIDPRFDLVDIDGNTIHLNADGKITVTDKSGNVVEKVEIKDKDGKETTGNLDKETYYEYTCRSKDEKAQTARLYYDAENEMYYLRWLDQEIPGCSIGAEELSVWRSRITVRAKEDFIGGNAVLTNGNQEDMNIVYAEAEETIEEGSDGIKSSGTDDMYRKDPEDEGTGSSKGNDEYPSKGFPRTTVNVKPLDYNVNGGEQLIYMGEYVTPEEILNELGESVETNDYWKFLKRYMEYSEKDTSTGEGIGTGTDTGTTDEDLLKTLLNKGEIKIPYTYLPESEEEKDADKESGVEQVLNQTGTNEHEADAFGIVTFTWGPADEEDESLDTKTPYETEDTQQKKYKLTVKYEPYKDGDFPEWGAEEASSTEPSKSPAETREKSGEAEEDVKDRYTILDSEDSLIDEDYYDTPKPPVGEEVTEETQKVGTHTTSIITGEITMEMCLAKSDLDYLAEHTTKENRKITYKAKLTRSWEDPEHIDEKKDSEEVGTYTMTIDLDKLNDGETYKTDTIDDVEYICVEGKIDLTDEEKKAYTGNTEYALPIGTYKLEKVTEETVEPSPFKFDDIEIVTITQADYKYFTILQFGTDGTVKGITPAKTSPAELSGTGTKTVMVGKNNPVMTKIMSSVPNQLKKNAGIKEILEPVGDETAVDYAAETDNETKTFYLGTENGKNTKPTTETTPVYTNRRLGLARISGDLELADIKISKKVVDTANEATKEIDKEFTFTVTFDGTNVSGDFDYKKYDSDGTEITSGTGTAFKIASGGTITLKDGENAVIEDLPVGTTVNVAETTVTNYETTAVVKDGMTEEATGKLEGEVYTVSVKLDEAKAADKDPVEVAYTNTYKAEGKLSLPVTKILEGRDPDVWVDSDEFTFELTITDSATVEAIKNGDIILPDTKKEINGTAGEVTGYTITVTIEADTADHKSVFEDILFHKVGTYKFSVKEVIPTDAVSNVKDHITYSTETAEVTVAVAEQKDGTKVNKNGILDVEATPNEVDFTNVYDPDDVEVTPAVEKTVEGEPFNESDDFTFTLTPEADYSSSVFVKDSSGTETAITTDPLSATVATTKTELTKTGNFNTLVFKKAGTYTFTIEEDSTKPTSGYTYDDHIWKLVVVVTDNADKGQLEATVTYKQYTKDSDGTLTEVATGKNSDNAAFTNIYNPMETTYTPRVEKVITGDVPPAENPRTFEFEISADTSNPAGGAVLPTETTASVEGAGTADFGGITFKKAGTYKFTITEKTGTDNGYSYDESSWTLTVVVEDNAKAELSVTSHTYTKADTGAAAGTSSEEYATFTNTYTTTESEPFTPQVKKTVTGEIAKDETFNFTLSPAAGNPENGVYLADTTTGKYDVVLTGEQNAAITITAAGTKNGTADFPSMVFKKAGTYTFTIKETTGSTPGYTYDKSEWTLTVVVEDIDAQLMVNKDKTAYVKTKDAEGKPVTSSDSAEIAEFTNVYATTPTEYAPKVVKKLEGDTPTTPIDFTFQLRSRTTGTNSGVVMPNPSTLTIHGAGEGTFDKLRFTKAGTYTFTIFEVNSRVHGYTYDTDPWTLTVVVEDKDSVLTVTSTTYTKDTLTSNTEATITNHYEIGTVNVVPVIQKTVTGYMPEEATFTFTLIPDSGNQDGAFIRPEVPYNTEQKAEVMVEAGGTQSNTADFPGITFKKAGTYKYLIKEVIPTATEAKTGYIYDDSEWTLTIVIKEEDSQLSVEKEEYTKTKDSSTAAGSSGSTSKQNAEFVNVYDLQPTSYAPNVEKVITGDAVPSKIPFNFRIVSVGASEGVTLPTPAELTINGAGNGAFGEITFKKPGTYQFTISEVKPNPVPGGYTYDETPWTLTIEVEDQNAALKVVSHIYTKAGATTSDDKATFTNDYKVEPVIGNPVVEKTVDGDAPSKQTFTFGLSGVSYKHNPTDGVFYTTDSGTEEPLSGTNQFYITIDAKGNDTIQKPFNNVTFKKAGTYYLAIVENQEEIQGYEFDNTAWYWVVKVVDTDGKLEIAEQYYCKALDESVANDVAKFVNVYDPQEVPLQVTVEKRIIGDIPPSAETFTFKLEEKDGVAQQGVRMPAVTTVEATATDPNSTLRSFADVIISEAGTYYFTISEVIPASVPAGYTYDTSKWDLEVTVVDRNGILVITSTKYTCGDKTSDTMAVFENEYATTPATGFVPKVQKTVDALTSITPTGAKFNFYMRKLSGPDGVECNALSGKEWVDLAEIDTQIEIPETGTVQGQFDSLTFTKAGTYVFEILEDVNSDVHGYTFDGSVWLLTVTVEDKDSQLQVTKAVYTRKGDNATAEMAEFTNIFNETIYYPHVHKEIVGNDRTEANEQEFIFEITPAETYSTDQLAMPENLTTVQKDHGTASFDGITFYQAGEYDFTIKEVPPVSAPAGYGYDTHEWTLHVSITENPEGRFKIVPTYSCNTCKEQGTTVEPLHKNNNREAFIVNTYVPAPVSYVAEVEKTVNGGAPTDKTFEFTLVPHGTKSDTVDIPADMKATVTGSGTGTFPAMTFHAAGRYQFEIQETDTEEKGYSYDRSLWILTVDVTDAGGTLNANAFYLKVGNTVEADKAGFTNSYRPLRTTYAPAVVKTISGDVPEQASVFTFNLAEDSSNPDGAVLPETRTLEIEGAGTGTFEEIIFAAPGTYKFKITETAGTDDAYTYDTGVWTLTVEVEDVDGELKTILTTYAKDDTTDSNSAQAEFVNKYTKYVESSGSSTESEEPTTEPSEPTTDPSGPTTEVQNPENPTTPPAEVVTPPTSGGSSESTPTETNHSAKTGDEAGLGLCMLCAAFALLGMAAVRRRRKRK